MLGLPIALFVANGFEWYAHKHLLHGVPHKGQPRYSPVPTNMKSHWAHHKLVRTDAYYDGGYVEGWRNWRTRNEIQLLHVFEAGLAEAALVVIFF